LKFISENQDEHVDYGYMQELSRGISLIASEKEITAASHLTFYALTRKNLISQRLDVFRPGFGRNPSDSAFPTALKDHCEACIDLLMVRSDAFSGQVNG
jgi:hypothetical protein